MEIATPGQIVDDILATYAPGPRGAGDAGRPGEGTRPPQAGRSSETTPFTGRSPYGPRRAHTGAGDDGPPGETGNETAAGEGTAGPWPDFPRTWDNPGFAIRYAYVRAGAVQRWARDLGVSVGAAVRPGLLDGPHDRAVLRVLAELPSRRESRDPGWAAYLERLAEAYHTAFEHASPLPKGDEPPSETHAARVRMAEAVRRVLEAGLAELGVAPPGKI
ncbi:MAG: anticodon-binding protein [Microbispora sp.]|nr:anticodon-binding protein [Microbispora sp.]